jgi:FtsP/CotA-like multicopper oxidase with cupredoxin domain
MSRNQRLGLLAAAIAVVVAAIVIAGGGDDDEESTQTTPPAADTATGGSPTATTPAAPEPARPDVQKIALRGFKPVGGVKEIEAAKGDTVQIAVTVDAEDELHLHGYDLTRQAAPGKPARFRFRADIEGVFELESHEAEHAGEESVVAKLVVSPS